MRVIQQRGLARFLRICEFSSGLSFTHPDDSFLTQVLQASGREGT